MDDRPVDWSRLALFREKARKQYRDVWGIPLVKRRWEVLKGVLREGMTVLDFGAGMQGAKEDIEKAGIAVTYRSMDIDRKNPHDYYSIDEIHERFDMVLFFEVIEHLSLEEGLTLLKRLAGLVKDGGSVVISTPNTFNPTRYTQDASHRTPYPYYDLCGVMEMAGFETTAVYRSYNDAVHRYFLKVHLLGPLFRFLSIDYAYSIFVVGKKRNE
jgi:2-polyprenyl-3-methyl-5-hydroxy-6-metoxy-1,4-benzoquinol methylase